MIDYVVHKRRRHRNFEIVRRDHSDRTGGLVGEAIAEINNEETAEVVAQILTREAKFFAPDTHTQEDTNE